MNTHILIPIKDIEDRINHLKELALIDQMSKDFEGEERIMIEIATINDIVNKGRRISLDEKGIEEKANKIYPVEMEYCEDAKREIDENFTYRHGYKQALKDLL